MSMADRDGFIWYDGKLVPWREANTHVLTHSLHYGLALFEGVRAYKTPQGTAIFRLKEHTERLFNSAKIFMMEIPFTQEQMCDAQREVVRANKLESCYLRPLVFYGSEKMGVSPKGAQRARGDRRLAVGCLPRRGGHHQGDPRQDLELPAPPHQRLDGADSRRRATTSTRSSPTRKRSTRATTRRCCSTPTASSPKVRARTCSSCATGRSTNPRWCRA